VLYCRGENDESIFMYGHRARIGYTCPPQIAEVFPYEFYKMAPEGVTLMITTLALTTRSKQEIDKSFEMSLDAARTMARAGASVVMLGGNPINLVHGGGDLREFQETLSKDVGVPVLTSHVAQRESLRLLGSRKVATVHPYESEHNARHDRQIKEFGCEPCGTVACDHNFLGLGSVPKDMALTLARRIKAENPAADTVHLASAHWATAHAIDQIECELAVSVMTSQQAIFWNAIRSAGIADKIPGYGRLLREF
jgi:maleate isomerase